MVQLVKNLSAMQEMWIQSLGQEESLKKEMAIHSSILAWEVPWGEEPGGLQGCKIIRHDLVTKQQPYSIPNLINTLSIPRLQRFTHVSSIIYMD